LASLGFWGVDVLVSIARGKTVAVIKSLDDGSQGKTRLCQYKAYSGEKGRQIVRQFVLVTIMSQIVLLRKYGFRDS